MDEPPCQYPVEHDGEQDQQPEHVVTNELAYTVEIESYRARVGGASELTPVAVRVTTVFRREDGIWKVTHRHADPITAPQPAESVIQR